MAPPTIPAHESGATTGDYDHWAVLAGVRFLLACMVMLFHCGVILPDFHLGRFAGFSAVLAFFIISGFSIAASVEREPKGYYQRRVLRIYPLVVTVMVLSWLVARFISPTLDGGEFPAMPVFLGNLFLLQGFFVPVSWYTVPMWTLSLECFYYLFAPWLKRASLRVLLAGVAVSAAMMAAYVLRGQVEFANAMYGLGAPCLAWAWLLGFIAWRQRGQVLFPLLLFILPQALIGIHGAGSFGFAGAILALTACAILYGDKIPLAKPVRAAAKYLGELSYPIYISHWTIILAFTHWVDLSENHPPLPRTLFLAIVASIFAVSALLYHLVDRPIRGWRARR